MTRIRPARLARVNVAPIVLAAWLAVPASAAAERRHCDGKCTPEAGPTGARHPRGMHHLLEGVALRPDQRDALERARGERRTENESVQRATAGFRAELARQVRAGAFQLPPLESLAAQASTELATAPDGHVLRLARLHAVLDPSQRAQVAERLVRAPKAAAPDRSHGPDEGRDGDEGAGPRDGAERGHPHGGGHGMGPGMHRAHRLLESLDLSTAQRATIRRALHERMRGEHSGPEETEMRGELHARMEVLAARFRAERFVPSEADRVPARTAGRRLTHLAIFAMTTTPHLTLTQRHALAARLEAGPDDDDGS